MKLSVAFIFHGVQVSLFHVFIVTPLPVCWIDMHSCHQSPAQPRATSFHVILQRFTFMTWRSFLCFSPVYCHSSFHFLVPSFISFIASITISLFSYITPGLLVLRHTIRFSLLFSFLPPLCLYSPMRFIHHVDMHSPSPSIYSVLFIYSLLSPTIFISSLSYCSFQLQAYL